MQTARNGPLITNLSNISSAPKWSFKGKSPHSARSATPGPGSYSSAGPDQHKYTKSPQFGFGSQPRDGSRPRSAPGPGQYTPSDNDRTSSAKYGFGSATRRAGPWRADQPGPGAYNTSVRVGVEGPKYSAGGRREGGSRPMTPGPGSYHPPTEGMVNQERAAPKWAFGTSPREGGSRGAIPGPGAYNAADALGAGPKYSFRAQLESARRPSTPGPGAHGGQWTQFG